MIGKRVSPYFKIASVYLFVIAIGSILLTLPISNQQAVWGNYINSLFTATSAMAVTGLVVADTATHWSVFGQITLLALIQIGGMGILTIIALVFKFISKRMSINNSNTLMVSAGALTKKEVEHIIKQIAITTFVCEFIGAVVLSVRFSYDFTTGDAIWKGVFTSISAFCNAGFDIMGTLDAKYVSLTGYSTDLVVNLTIMLLIQMGGLGFMVWRDVVKNKLHLKKYKLHSRIVIVVNFVLVVVGAVLFLLLEYNNKSTMGDMSVGNKVLASFFQSITCRTAGFNTIDMASMNEGSYMVSMILMAIGGGSGSTAGGMKITTFVVVISTIYSLARGKRSVEIGKRSLSNEIVNQSLLVFILWTMFTVVGTSVLCIADNVPVMHALFECYSALGTVGLSVGITSALSVVSRIMLIMLMFIGRVGVITMVFSVALNNKKNQNSIIKPQENILIG